MSTERLVKHFKMEDTFQVGGQGQRCTMTDRFAEVQHKIKRSSKNRVKHRNTSLKIF